METQTNSTIYGGCFLIQTATPEQTFIPEDIN